MPNILIIDDEVGMREGCRRALIRQGFKVSTAEQGAEGLRLLREQPFDLVLLDAMMPGMSGLEILDRIQERESDVMCVMITGYATVDLAAQAMKKGAQGFLPKPFTSDDLLRAVHGGLDERARRLNQRDQTAKDEEALQRERARQEQAKLDAITSRFLLVVVHELRNPAGAIKNMLQLIRGGYVEDGERDEYLERLDLRAGQLLSMLDDLLELACLKEVQSPSRLGPVAVAGVLEGVVRQLRPKAQAKGLDLQLQIEAQPTMLAQPAHLHSLWHHLIDNAICYTPRGQVRVTLSERPSRMESTVSDTGIGLSSEDVSRIFGEFYRSEQAKAQVPLGTGLGLAIVDQIVKTYLGTIQVDSTPGEGSTFTVSLPLTA